jgi:hypothetical protein
LSEKRADLSFTPSPHSSSVRLFALLSRLALLPLLCSLTLLQVTPNTLSTAEMARLLVLLSLLAQLVFAFPGMDVASRRRSLLPSLSSYLTTLYRPTALFRRPTHSSLFRQDPPPARQAHRPVPQPPLVDHHRYPSAHLGQLPWRRLCRSQNHPRLVSPLPEPSLWRSAW